MGRDHITDPIGFLQKMNFHPETQRTRNISIKIPPMNAPLKEIKIQEDGIYQQTDIARTTAMPVSIRQIRKLIQL